jgi:hypothetical protein
VIRKSVHRGSALSKSHLGVFRKRNLLCTKKGIPSSSLIDLEHIEVNLAAMITTTLAHCNSVEDGTRCDGSEDEESSTDEEGSSN